MTSHRRNRSQLLLGCGSVTLALALATAPTTGRTQAINASEKVVSGTAFRVSTGAGTEEIEVETQTAIIDWTPFQDQTGNALDFLPRSDQHDLQRQSWLRTGAEAGIVNGEIIPSANYEVSGRTVDGGSISDGIDAVFDGNSELINAADSIFVNNFTATSSLLAIANADVEMTAVEASSSVDGDLLVAGRAVSGLVASAGGAFDISDHVLVSARDYGRTGVELFPGEADAAGGAAFIDVTDGGSLSIAGDVLVSADAVAGTDSVMATCGSAAGGSAIVGVTGGALTIGGDATVGAAAFGSVNANQSAARDVQGGEARVFAEQGGTIQFDGDLALWVAATGTDAAVNAVSRAADVFGGVAGIDLFSGGSIKVDAALSLYADTSAGLSNTSDVGAAADAGDASIFIENDETLDLRGSVLLRANAIGGANLLGRGGNGSGGAARAFVRNEGTLLVGEADDRIYAARGLAAYDGALELGVTSLAQDSVVSGEVDIPLTQTTDALQFARQQAESISADQALVEAYRRANSGEFAEAAQFFGASAEKLSGTGEVEARLNEALLQSNLGNFMEARRGFARTRMQVTDEPVLARLQRNYEAIDALNQGAGRAVATAC